MILPWYVSFCVAVDIWSFAGQKEKVTFVLFSRKKEETLRSKGRRWTEVGKRIAGQQVPGCWKVIQKESESSEVSCCVGAPVDTRYKEWGFPFPQDPSQSTWTQWDLWDSGHLSSDQKVSGPAKAFRNLSTNWNLSTNLSTNCPRLRQFLLTWKGWELTIWFKLIHKNNKMWYSSLP